MSEMVERVARALLYMDGGKTTAWIGQNNFIKEDYRRWARAAIEAMREPTEEMVTCLQKTNIPNLQFRGLWEGMWQAMIDEALK